MEAHQFATIANRKAHLLFFFLFLLPSLEFPLLTLKKKNSLFFFFAYLVFFFYFFGQYFILEFLYSTTFYFY